MMELSTDNGLDGPESGLTKVTTSLRSNLEDENKYSTLGAIDSVSSGNYTHPLSWIANSSMDYNTSVSMDDGTASQILKGTTQTLSRFNSTLIRSILNLTDTTIETNADNDHSLLSTELPTDKPKFSSMEIWFIATGSVILAVIVLFCINTCIQCQLFEKIAKKFKRRNQMAELEKRSHKDRDLICGGHQDHANTHTHLFLHIHPHN